MKNLKVEIDARAGFCPGVAKAVALAEKELARGAEILSLGFLAHNDEELKRLGQLGMSVVNIDNLHNLKDEKVIIRAHGEPPATFELAKKMNLTVVDATCVIVARLQLKVKELTASTGLPLVIYGKKEHPEVRGLAGYSKTPVMVISPGDDELLPAEFILISQTTMDREKLFALKTQLEAKGHNVHFFDTTCSYINRRRSEVAEFARKYDRLIFVAGKNSSNGKALFDLCQKVNPNSIFISSAEDIDAGIFQYGESVGITGAASTPRWQLEEVRDCLAAL